MNPGRRSSRHPRRPALLATRLLAAGGLCLALLAAGCGGGTSQFEPYVPDQYVAFGDEASVVLTDGRRFTVNPINSFGAVDCRTEPIWTQAVATHYGFTFAECNPDGVTEFKARVRAAAGARAIDLSAQIDAHLAAGGFAPKTVATVMLGTNDVLELYAQYPTRSEEDITNELRERGVQLAGQVNRLVDLGVRVIVATAPDLALSPFGAAQKAAFTDTDRAALLSRLTAAINGRLRINILNDGRFVGLVLADEAILTITRAPAVFGIDNVSSAVCTVALPDCSTQTLATGGTSARWLWADDRQLAYGGQLRLGTLAVARAANNPF